MKTKKCLGCNSVKEESSFAKRSDRPSGIQSRCRDCQSKSRKDKRLKSPDVLKLYDRKGHLKQTYDLTMDQYNEMFKNQSGQCKGCGKFQHELKRRLDVDHDHKTGKVRGLLCLNCNRTIGYAKDSIEILQKLIEYLKTAG